MKNLTLLITILLSTGCNLSHVIAQTSIGKHASMEVSQEEKEERNKQIALANARAIHNHDIVAASKSFAPDIINYGNGAMPPQRGIEAVTSSLRMFINAFPIDSIDNLVAVADGDWVFLWGKWSGTWKEDFMGQKATGK